MSDTPETDAAIVAAGGDWSPVLRAVAQRLERERNGARELAEAFHRDQVTLLLERDEARKAFVIATDQMVIAQGKVREANKERDEARAERDILKLDAQREAEHHDRMVGELEKVYAERDRLDNALMKIEDLFIGGTDIYADRENMGLIARAALAQHK